MMMLLLVLLSVIDAGLVVRERVDMIELNHVYDDQGRHVLDQIIFWDFIRYGDRWLFAVRKWEPANGRKHKIHKDWSTGDTSVTWHDNFILRKVTARIYKETWTQDDPEAINRDKYPMDIRRGLRARW